MQQIFLAFLCGFLLDKGGLSITARLNVFSELVGLIHHCSGVSIQENHMGRGSHMCSCTNY